MAKTNFRQRKITNRTNITSRGIAQLRATRIKHATSQRQIRYYESASFEKQINRNVRQNIRIANVKRLTRISEKLTPDARSQKGVFSLYGEKAGIRNGKVVNLRSLGSKRQFKRLKDIERKIDKGTYNINRVVGQNQNYKKVKRYIGNDATESAKLSAVVNEEFYYENRTKIRRFNKMSSSKGYEHAKNTKTGTDLSNAYNVASEAEDSTLVELALDFA